MRCPLGPSEACERLKKEADEFLCLATPELFMAVGEWFKDFRQVSDAEVQRLLEESRQQTEAAEALELPHKR